MPVFGLFSGPGSETAATTVAAIARAGSTAGPWTTSPAPRPPPWAPRSTPGRPRSEPAPPVDGPAPAVRPGGVGRPAALGSARARGPARATTREAALAAQGPAHRRRAGRRAGRDRSDARPAVRWRLGRGPRQRDHPAGQRRLDAAHHGGQGLRGRGRRRGLGARGPRLGDRLRARPQRNAGHQRPRGRLLAPGARALRRRRPSDHRPGAGHRRLQRPRRPAGRPQAGGAAARAAAGRLGQGLGRRPGRGRRAIPSASTAPRRRGSSPAWAARSRRPTATRSTR